MKQTQTSHQRWFNIILAILLIITVIAWVIDEEKDNAKEGAYLQIISDYEGQRSVMVEGANKLYRSLKECREEVKNAIN